MKPLPVAGPAVPRALWGATLGVVCWPVDLVGAVVALVAVRRPVPPVPVRTLVGWHRRRVTHLLGAPDDATLPVTAPAPPRAVGYLLARVGVGLIGTVVLVLLAYGLFSVAAVLLSWLFDVRITADAALPREGLTTSAVLTMVPVGAVLLYLNLMGLVGVGLLDRAAARSWLSPSRSERLTARVEELTVSRVELLLALDVERGRIERDLHDGVQQRAVALGLLVNRARRRTERGVPAYALLEQAGAEAERLLTDLREVAWRVRPTTLDTHGLVPVLQQLTSHAAVPTVLDWPDPVRLPPAVETTAYYVVAEALTNVAKHSGAHRASVSVRVCDGTGRPRGEDVSPADLPVTQHVHGRPQGEGAALVALPAAQDAPGRSRDRRASRSEPDDPRDRPEPRRIRVVIGDDGVGGAQVRPGSGLSGLENRVVAAGGTLSVDSPEGGPTTIEVTLPCE